MEQMRVLVIDLFEEAVLGDSVRQILSGPPERWGPIVQKSLFLDTYETEAAELVGPVAAFHAHLLLLITTPETIGRAAKVIRQTSKSQRDVPIMVIGSDLSQAGLIELLSLGAADYLTAPLKAIDLLPRIWRLARRRDEKEQVAQKLMGKLGLERIVGGSEGFLSEVRKIPIVAKCDAAVLIIGETGTGKELCARAVHYLSPRSDHPFVAVNCGAIHPELIENELFGHTRGAYTGAHASQPGLIGEADGGTLFLDDVESLPLPAQSKFLRFLQEKEYRRLGSPKTLRADVRVVAATNVDPEEAARRGTLRRDLLYRLNVVPLTLPPLRSRESDIPLLAHHFLEKYSYEFKKEVHTFSAEALARLVAYDWPGNVRELENVVERAVVFAVGPLIEADRINLPREAAPPFPTHPGSLKEEKAKLIWQFEKDFIERLLRQYQGNITQAARAAKKNRRAFWELVRKYKVDMRGLTTDYPSLEQDKDRLKQDNFILAGIS